MPKKHISNDERREMAWDNAKIKDKDALDRMLAYLKLSMTTFESDYSTKCKLLMLGDFHAKDLKKVSERAENHSEEL